MEIPFIQRPDENKYDMREFIIREDNPCPGPDEYQLKNIFPLYDNMRNGQPLTQNGG